MRLFTLAFLAGSFAYAQDLATLPLKKGVAVATCFSGWKTQGNNNWTIDLDAPVMGLVDVHDQSPGTNYGPGNNWKPAMFHNETATANANKWTARRMGQVFGVAIDKRGNIFVAASRVYGAQGGVGETGAGLWGSAGPGGVYRIDGTTGNVTDFITTNSAPTYTTASGNANKIPNTGPGLGNLAYDEAHDQLLVTNFEDGKIYRLTNLTLNTGIIPSAPYDPFNADDGSAGFADPGLLPGNGTQIGQRLWGIGVFANRVFFSVWAEDEARSNRSLTNSIHSVAINANGTLNGTTIRKEIDAPNNGAFIWSNPVSDIEFSSGGKMLVAERTQLIPGFPESSKDLVIPPTATGQSAHKSRVIEYSLSGSLSNVYTASIYPLWIGEAGNNTNSAGGVDYGYLEYDENTEQLGGCEMKFWASGDYLRSAPGIIYGLQGTTLGVNTPGTSDDLFIDLNGVLGTQDKTKIGDVDIFRSPCGVKNVTDVTGYYLDCVNEGAGQYNFVLTVANNNDTDAYGAILILPNGATTNVTFNPPLAPGATTTVTVPITIGIQTAGTNINFVFQFHGKPLPPPLSYEWCDKPLTIPVKVPDCGCLTATIGRGILTNGLSITIKNLVIDPGATMVTLDAKTAGVTIAPASIALNIPYGGSVTIPITITPAPAPGSFVRLAVGINGKKLGNGVYENCCMEENEFLIPRLAIPSGATGVYGRLFEDVNTTLKFESRDRPLAGIPVALTGLRGEDVTTRTNESGEYFLPVPASDVEQSVTIVVDPPTGLALARRHIPIRMKTAKGQIVEIADTPLLRPAALPNTPAPTPGIPPVLPNVVLNPITAIGGETPSAISYSVPEGPATLRLLNDDGAQVTVLHDGYHSAGDYVAIVRSHDVPMGFYTLELNAAGEAKQQSVFVAPIEAPAPQSAAKQAGVKLFRVSPRE